VKKFLRLDTIFNIDIRHLLLKPYTNRYVDCEFNKTLSDHRAKCSETGFSFPSVISHLKGPSIYI
jgi:hypothetical protein